MGARRLPGAGSLHVGKLGSHMRNAKTYAVARFLRSGTGGSLLLAAVVGLFAGMVATAFRWMIAGTQQVVQGAPLGPVGVLGDPRLVLGPAVGGLLVGLLVYFLAREAKGSGIPEVILAVARNNGNIRGRVSIVKFFASAICIGSGGSAGREGPIVQIGSSLASAIAQALRLPAEHVRLLATCGVAAGVAATFNAPIGGALFALEVILRDFGVRSFGLVVLSCVAATAFSHATLGDVPAFRVPAHQPVTAQELPLFAMLGVLAAVVSIVFTRSLYWVSDRFDGSRLPQYAPPAVGGLFVGLLGAMLPGILGVGYETIEPALATQLGIGLCASLTILKLVATSLTIGSGGSGGVFAPCLFIGATFGSMFGQVMQRAMPGVVTNPETYAIAGMGAVFTGAARAPVSSVLILFEMTADYRIIIPLMAAIVVSSLVAERLLRHDIYTIKLARRGIDIKQTRPSDPMTAIRVDEVMTSQVDTVPHDMPLEQLADEFRRSGHHGFPVVDSDGLLVGIVSLSDLGRAASRGLHDRLVGDIATTNVMVCQPQQSLREALADPAAG